MSSYGDPPSDPYGPQPGSQPGPQPGPPAQNPYDQPGQQPYGQPGWHPGYYAQGPAQFRPGVGYAPWGARVGAYVVDALIVVLLTIPVYVGVVLAAGTTRVEFNTTTSQYETVTEGSSSFGWVLIALGLALSLGFFLWNWVLRQGRTGYTVGKGLLGIKLVGDQTGEPIGPGMSFLRQVAHVLDQLPCYLGYFWPLWDPKKQTFADKLVNTVVINQPKD